MKKESEVKAIESEGVIVLKNMFAAVIGLVIANMINF